MDCWVHFRPFFESMDMRQLFGYINSSGQSLKGCKNFLLQKSHFYSINQIFWNSKSNFSKLMQIFDPLLFLEGWLNIFLLVFMIFKHFKTQNQNLENFYLQKIAYSLEGKFFSNEYLHWYTEIICIYISSTNCPNPGELKYGLKLDKKYSNLPLMLV